MSPFCLGNRRFSLLNYLVLIISLYKGNRALKGSLLSQFWLGNQRLMPLVPRTPTAGRCGPGHLRRARSQAEIGSVTTGDHPLQPSGAASEEGGTEGLREHFLEGGLVCGAPATSTPFYLWQSLRGLTGTIQRAGLASPVTP